MDKSPGVLGDIPTQWSKIFQAQQSRGSAGESARRELLVRYYQAIQAFFRRELSDPHAADALYSNFAVRILEVDNLFKRVDPDKGRFRDYLKVILRHMVIDHYRQQQRDNQKRQELIPGSDNEPIAASGDLPQEDERFVQCWRQELINQAWNALLAVEQEKRQPYGTLLRMQEQNPTLRAAQLAEKLTQITGKAQTPENIRQLIHRGRKLFGKLLVEEVARSLGQSAAGPVGAEKVEQELIDLGLLFSYCKDALKERQGP
jgi:RNA polymerase sigma factor (sigma-70 family)